MKTTMPGVMFVLTCAIALGGCTDRAADLAAGDAGMLDLASPPGAADLALVRQPDLASALGSDAGTSFAGIPCGDAVCPGHAGQVCCFRPVTPMCTASAVCGLLQSNQCDGPEDCAAGQLCAMVFGNDGWGARCLAKPAGGGASDAQPVICHSAAECGPGQLCDPLETQGGLRGCYQP